MRCVRLAAASTRMRYASAGSRRASSARTNRPAGRGPRRSKWLRRRRSTSPSCVRHGPKRVQREGRVRHPRRDRRRRAIDKAIDRAIDKMGPTILCVEPEITLAAGDVQHVQLNLKREGPPRLRSRHGQVKLSRAVHLQRRGRKCVRFVVSSAAFRRRAQTPVHVRLGCVALDPRNRHLARRAAVEFRPHSGPDVGVLPELILWPRARIQAELKL